MLYCIIGKSASGKDIVLENILSKSKNLKRVVNFTTRPKREGEVEGVDYRFITADELKEKMSNQDVFISTSYVVANGEVWTYGIEKSKLEEKGDKIMVTNDGSINKLSQIKDMVCFYIENDNIAERFKRRIDREGKENLEEICRRMIVEEKDYNETVLNKEYIIPINGERSVDEIANDILKEMRNRKIKQIEDAEELNLTFIAKKSQDEELLDTIRELTTEMNKALLNIERLEKENNELKKEIRLKRREDRRSKRNVSEQNPITDKQEKDAEIKLANMINDVLMELLK